MYAVAIWDRQLRSLTLARDPLGIKPLYYTCQNSGIAFGSELRALRVLPEHRFSIDERAVDDFFSFGHVQKPRSIFTEVSPLAPGQVLRIGANGDPETAAFWRPHFRIRDDLSVPDWIEEPPARVTQTVRNHLLSDVPVGAFLSGGIDSGTVTAIMGQAAATPVKAFTLGFPDSRLDETDRASRIATSRL